MLLTTPLCGARREHIGTRTGGSVWTARLHHIGTRTRDSVWTAHRDHHYYRTVLYPCNIARHPHLMRLMPLRVGMPCFPSFLIK
eukprot:3449662-Heterocapsa_arctica.AAC.1